MTTPALPVVAFALLCALGLAAWAGSVWQRRRALREAARSEARWREQAEQQARLAAAEERERIYNDLHDDLGARLLQMVYSAPSVEYADQARAVLQDLRDVVSRSRGAPGDLEQVLGDLRNEATQRLAAVGTRLRWEQPEQLPAIALAQARALHLYRIVREAISNALRHAPARQLRVRIRVSESLLAFELTDDGEAPPQAPAATGQGMRSMQQRADQLQGAIRWTRGTAGGTKVLLTLPLQE